MSPLRRLLFVLSGPGDQPVKNEMADMSVVLDASGNMRERIMGEMKT